MQFFVGNFLLLGWIGQQPIEQPFVSIGFNSTVFYFIAFLIDLPVLALIKLLQN